MWQPIRYSDRYRVIKITSVIGMESNYVITEDYSITVITEVSNLEMNCISGLQSKERQNIS